jgi:predicted Na+-dependent transporter
VIGLVLVGLLAAAHAREHYDLNSGTFFETILAAFSLNLAGCLVGGAAFAFWGRKEPLTIGLVTGNRNVTLAWAIAGSALPAAAEDFVVAAVIPVLALPLALKAIRLISPLLRLTRSAA